MAEKKTAKATAAAPVAEAPPASRKKSGLKTGIILLAVLVVEGLIIAGVFMVMGKPADVRAEGAAADAVAVAERQVEELVVSDKFPNTRSGRSYLYDTEVFIVVRRKHQEQVKARIADMNARITTEMATIFRRAEPAQLEEPTLATITRQIKASLDDLLGRDPDSGASVVEKVLIRKCTRFRADY